MVELDPHTATKHDKYGELHKVLAEKQCVLDGTGIHGRVRGNNGRGCGGMTEDGRLGVLRCCSNPV